MPKHTFDISGSESDNEKIITVFLRDQQGYDSAKLRLPVTLPGNDPQSHNDLIGKEYRRALSQFGEIETLGLN